MNMVNVFMEILRFINRGGKVFGEKLTIISIEEGVICVYFDLFVQYLSI